MFGTLSKEVIKPVSLNNGIAKTSSIKTPVTRRTYSNTMSDVKKKALEALHLTREAIQTEQRKLQKLRITTEKENILAEEKILEDTIKRLKQEENNHERHLKNIYIRKN
jgi:hypothetical protein